MHDQHRKGLEFMKQLQTEIWEIKNSVENMSGRSDQCEDRVSELEHKATVSD